MFRVRALGFSVLSGVSSLPSITHHTAGSLLFLSFLFVWTRLLIVCAFSPLLGARSASICTTLYYLLPHPHTPLQKPARASIPRLWSFQPLACFWLAPLLFPPLRLRSFSVRLRSCTGSRPLGTPFRLWLSSRSFFSCFGAHRVVGAFSVRFCYVAVWVACNLPPRRRCPISLRSSRVAND